MSDALGGGQEMMPIQAPVTPLSQHGRLAWLDGLRAYAIVGVILMHSSFFVYSPREHVSTFESGVQTFALTGQYGVQLFFVISALTVFFTLGQFPFSWATFRGWLIKRYFRIAPLYYLAIPFYFVMNEAENYGRVRFHKLPHPLGTPFDALLNVLFVHAWSPNAINSIVPGGWSIGIEMMFYLLAPVFFWILWRGRTSYIVLPLVAIAGVWLTRWLAGGTVFDDTYFYFWLPTELPVFLTGILLCRLCRSWLFNTLPVPRYAVLVAVSVCLPSLALGCLFGVVGSWNNGFAPAILGVGFAAVIVLARGPLQMAFSNPLAVWLGRRSYSMYILHFSVLYVMRSLDGVLRLTMRVPVVVALAAAAVLATAITAWMANFTMSWIEEPGNRLGRKLAGRAVRNALEAATGVMRSTNA
jgi:peptidoglycan/LPS O-acetylase OafA/YrhL